MKIVKGVTVNGSTSLVNNAFAQVTELREVSTAWKQEQSKIVQRKSEVSYRRRRIEESGAYAQLFLANVAPIHAVNQDKFLRISREIFPDVDVVKE